MGETILNRWENGVEKRIEIVDFKGVDTSVNASKLAINRFPALQNFVKRRTGDVLSLQKRFGIQRSNSNQLSASNPVMNLFEAKLNDNYYMIGKDNAGSGSSALKYCATDYSGSWSSINASEYASYYRYLLFKNSVYVCNRLNSSDVIQTNRVWQGSTNYYEHGCIPQNTDGNTLSGGSAGGLDTTKVYWYAFTYLYDGFQESGCIGVKYIDLASTYNSVTITLTSSLPNARIKAVNIYRSQGTSNIYEVPQYFYFLSTVVDALPLNFVDVRKDSELSEQFDIKNLLNVKRPYRSKYFAVAKGRLILANLETSSLRYDAIVTGEITATRTATAGSLTAGVYKYRFFKAYSDHSGGATKWLVGTYLEKSITSSGSDSTDIDLTGYTSFEVGWNNYVYIERTVSGGNDFFFLACKQLGELDAVFNDGLSDTNLKAITKDYNIQKQIVPNYTVTKTKGTIAISDVGKPDLFDATSVKVIEENSNQGITGIFTERSRVVIFTPLGIHGLDTDAASSLYWTPYKIVAGIGANGQDTSPRTETAGHSGILQLPNDTGYIFFNRANASTGKEVKIYYWDGQSYPKLISNEIGTYLNNGFTTFRVYGMAYDRINNWAWMVVTTNSAKYVFVYDLNEFEWYVFALDTSVVLYDMVVTEEGKIIFGADGGRLEAYTADTYQDNYGSSPTTYAFTGTIRTKTIDEFDSDLVLKQVIINCETSSNQISCSCAVVADAVSNSETFSNTNTTTFHRLRNRMRYRGKSIYFTFNNSENKNVLIQRIALDFKSKNQSRDGYG